MTMAQRVFISYSTKDYQKVRRIKDYLESVGIPCWMADEGIRSGEQFKTVIVKAIVKTDILVFFSSQASNASEWTTKEINTAVHLGKKIVPVKLDKAPYNESILFDIGALDYVDVSTVAKSVSGLAKLKDTLLTLLNNPATPDIPEPKPSHKRPHRALALGIAIGVILAGVVCGILLSLPPRVHKERTSDGNITYRIGHASFRMMRVRGGEFTMGSNYRESDQQYELWISELKLQGGCITSYKRTSRMRISDTEAYMSLSHSEFIMVYTIAEDAEQFTQESTPLVKRSTLVEEEDGISFMLFRPNNNHVNTSDYKLYDDIFGIYHITSTGQFICSSGNQRDLAMMELDLVFSPIYKFLTLTGNYELNEPVMAQFLSSGYDDFNEFLRQITQPIDT